MATSPVSPQKRPREDADDVKDLPDAKRARTPRYYAFLRMDAKGDDSDAVFLLDLDSTPDADKIVALLRRLIENYDERVNILFFCFSQGMHPKTIAENDYDEHPDLLAGLDHRYQRHMETEDGEIDASEWPEIIGEDITDIGTWKTFGNGDDGAEVDLPCVHLLRFFTHF